MKLRLYPRLLAGALAVAAASPIVAQDGERARYADLDLTRPEGVAELNQRVARAAKRICYRAWDGSSQTEWAYLACRRDTVANARLLVTAASARSAVQVAAK